MASTVSRNCVVEYDNTGNPTGNIYVDGKRFALGSFTNLGTFPVPSGTASTTKFLIQRIILVTNPEPTTVGQTATVWEFGIDKDQSQSVTF